MPLHASPDTPALMPLDRAVAIVKAINQRAFFAMGICEKCDSLQGVSLAEMIAAKDRVELENAAAKSINGVRHLYVVPDDRLIAAVYALHHYDGNDEAVVIGPGRDGPSILKALCVVDLRSDAGDAE